MDPSEPKPSQRTDTRVAALFLLFAAVILLRYMLPYFPYYRDLLTR